MFEKRTACYSRVKGSLPSKQHPNVLSAPTSGPQAELHSEPTQAKIADDLKQREEKRVKRLETLCRRGKIICHRRLKCLEYPETVEQ